MPLSYLSKLPFTIKFLISAISGIIFWYVSRNFYFVQQLLHLTGLADCITSSLQYWVTTSLDLLNINSYSQSNEIMIENSRGMRIIFGCLAISHSALFTGLIIAYPGKWISKIWYLPVGLITLHLLNALRLILIGIILYYAPSYGEQAHYYFTRFILYGGVLILWLFFLIKIARKQ